MMAGADAELQPLVAAEFQKLASALADIREPQWSTPSLCEKWSVRNVVAHLTMAERYTAEQFQAELEVDGFDFGALSQRIADRDADLPLERLLANLRSDAMAHWAPPGGGYAGALSHVVIHGLDATVPLGLGSVGDPTAVRTVLDGLATGGVHDAFGTSVDGIELRATDQDWTFGSGRPLATAAHELVLLLAGRSLEGVTLNA